MPSRTVERFTPNCFTSSASVPRGSPGRITPARIRCSIASATSRYAGVALIRRNFSESAVIFLTGVAHRPTIRRNLQSTPLQMTGLQSDGGGSIGSMNAAALLRVQHVGVRFGGIVALDD